MRTIACTAVLLALAGATAMAQAGDPPARVGRLNYLNGPVSFRPASVEEWAAASLNYPLTTGDHLWADDGAQTEIHIGSTAVRMGVRTAISFLNLDDRIAQISLTQGELNVHIRFLGENESFEVDTPNAAVSLLRSGDYRINANGDDAVTVVNVRGGEAEVTVGGSAFPVRSGQSARLAGMENPQQEISAVAPPDGFDQWCAARERREAASVSARYVPREMVGYEDLDEYGMWVNMPPYGWVWRPRTVAVGWAPYHYGHWAWVEPWGWTWVDDAPWGFAPFHYGRWAFAGGFWVWAPGRMEVVGVAAVRPVYAPALVAFVGGPHFSVAVGVGGGVGMAAWFPLGPGEVYRPAYHVSPAYVQNVNITHVTNVTVINNVNVTNVRYVNQNVTGAVTVVPHDAFVSARPVAAASVRVTPGVMAQAQVVGTTAPIVPRRESVLATTSVTPVHAPPERFVAREVVARTPPPPPPVPFAAKQQALQANGGRPLAPEQLSTIRAAAPPRAPMVRTAGQPAARPQTDSAPRLYGRPPQQPQTQQPQQVGRPPQQPQTDAAPRQFGRPPQQPQTQQPQQPQSDAAPRQFGRPPQQPQTQQPQQPQTESAPRQFGRPPQQPQAQPQQQAPPRPAVNDRPPAPRTEARPATPETARPAAVEHPQEHRKDDRPANNKRKVGEKTEKKQ